jgi:hypothetical protein
VHSGSEAGQIKWLTRQCRVDHPRAAPIVGHERLASPSPAQLVPASATDEGIQVRIEREEHANQAVPVHPEDQQVAILRDIDFDPSTVTRSIITVATQEQPNRRPVAKRRSAVQGNQFGGRGGHRQGKQQSEHFSLRHGPAGTTSSDTMTLFQFRATANMLSCMYLA